MIFQEFGHFSTSATTFCIQQFAFSSEERRNWLPNQNWTSDIILSMQLRRMQLEASVWCHSKSKAVHRSHVLFDETQRIDEGHSACLTPE